MKCALLRLRLFHGAGRTEDGRGGRIEPRRHEGHEEGILCPAGSTPDIKGFRLGWCCSFVYFVALWLTTERDLTREGETGAWGQGMGDVGNFVNLFRPLVHIPEE